MEQADGTVSVFLVLFGLVQTTISGKTINQPMTVFWGLCGKVQREPQPQCPHQGHERRSDATARPLAGTWLEAETEERLMFSLGSGSTIPSDTSGGQLFEPSADGNSYRVGPDGLQGPERTTINHVTKKRSLKPVQRRSKLKMLYIVHDITVYLYYGTVQLLLQVFTL